MSHDREQASQSATEVVKHVSTIPPNSHVALWLRVSTPKQARNGNLQDQLNYLTHVCTIHQLNIAHVESHTGPANPTNLIDLTYHCTENNITYVLAESLCRYVRHPRWSPKNCHLQPTEHDLKLLAHFTKGVTLTTVTDPSAELSQVRGLHTSRGMRLEDVFSGGDTLPGKRGRRKDRCKQLVQSLYRDGVGYRTISKRMWVLYGEKISFMTVKRWVKEG